MCMSYMATPIYIRASSSLSLYFRLNSSIPIKIFVAEIPLLNSSRMAGRGGRGRGRGANEPPPPPDYMAAMMQQFELNRQFMENVMAQFPQPNQNGPPHQPAPVPLHDFPRLNPTMFRNTVQPLDADDWLRDITHELESANVDPAD